MKPIRFALCLFAALFFLQSVGAWAQYGGGRRDRGTENQNRGPRNDTSTQKPQAAPVSDPIAAVERELPSLRIDMKLDAQQAPLFDRFERMVREAGSAARNRSRHLSAFRLDDGSTVSASSLVGTVAADDQQRADAMRGVMDCLEQLYAALQPDQRKQFDRRIMVAVRDPLGAS